MESETIKKVALGTAGLLVAGGLIYYLAQDPVKIDPKLHTQEAMLAILDELKLEYMCVYVRNFNKILQFQKDHGHKGPLDAKELEAVKHQIEGEKSDKLKQLQGRNPKLLTNTEVLNKWIDINKDLPAVKKNAEDLMNMHDDLFDKNQINHPGFSDILPERLTQDRYIRIYTKIFATLRYDLFMKLEAYKEENKLSDASKIDEQKFNSMWYEVWDSFESVRHEIFNFMMTTSKV